MDQRIVGTGAVRCVGSVLLLGGRVYSPPYVISAIGDTSALRAALDNSPDIKRYREYVDAYGLGYKVEGRRQMTISGYTGSLDLQYAKALR
jgi:uncharacterized protein YlxW (UPF0749 family)